MAFRMEGKMKVLLAVDSITTLNILIDGMTDRSWPSGTEARVLSIVEDGEVPLKTWREQGYGTAAVRQQMRKRGEEITAVAIERLQQLGIPAEVLIVRGNADFLISFAAKQWSADLILIRAHNRTDFRNWMLGSVARSVVEGAPCSVEVVRNTRSGAGSADPIRILLAADGSGTSLAAARAVANTSWPENTEVKVVSVVNPMIYSLEEIGLLSDSRTWLAHQAIGQAVQVLKDTPLIVSGEVTAGETARQIIEQAKSWRAGLIVLGTHERRGLKRFLLGSTSATVAQRAHCSVRVIRGPDVSRNEHGVTRRSGASPHQVRKIYKQTDNSGWRRAA